MDSDKYRQVFEDTLRRLMKNNHLSVEKLVRESGIAASTIQGWIYEHRWPSTYSLLVIAAFFHISMDELFGRKV